MPATIVGLSPVRPSDGRVNLFNGQQPELEAPVLDHDLVDEGFAADYQRSNNARGQAA